MRMINFNSLLSASYSSSTWQLQGLVILKLSVFFWKRNKKIKKIHTDSRKSIILFEIEKGWVTWLFMRQFFYQVFNNFLALLSCEIDVFDTFNMLDFFQICFIIRSTKMLIEWNFELGMLCIIRHRFRILLLLILDNDFNLYALLRRRSYILFPFFGLPLGSYIGTALNSSWFGLRGSERAKHYN